MFELSFPWPWEGRSSSEPVPEWEDLGRRQAERRRRWRAKVRAIPSEAVTSAEETATPTVLRSDEETGRRTVLRSGVDGTRNGNELNTNRGAVCSSAPRKSPRSKTKNKGSHREAARHREAAVHVIRGNRLDRKPKTKADTAKPPRETAGLPMVRGGNVCGGGVARGSQSSSRANLTRRGGCTGTQRLWIHIK